MSKEEALFCKNISLKSTQNEAEPSTFDQKNTVDALYSSPKYSLDLLDL